MEIVEIMLERIRDLYGGGRLISGFLSFVKRCSKAMFLYLEDPEEEKTADKSEHHSSIQPSLFKHRFKTKDGFLKMSYWYHKCLSTGG